MYRFDRTIIVPSLDLYTEKPQIPEVSRAPDLVGAIGTVQPTDVLLVGLDFLDLPGPVPGIPWSRQAMPGGEAAVWSFGELLRVAAAAGST